MGTSAPACGTVRLSPARPTFFRNRPVSASSHALDPATFRTDFVRFAIDTGVLRFGSFKTKAGRMSPYFFNAGLFNSGATVGKLAAFYAQALLAANVEFDMLFGPAYKGIGLATATSVALAEKHGRDVPLRTTARRPRTTARAVRWWVHRCRARS